MKATRQSSGICDYMKLRLEDFIPSETFVLGVQFLETELTVSVIFALGSSSSHWKKPVDGEFQDYRNGTIVFSRVEEFSIKKPLIQPSIDATGVADFGCIDLIEMSDPSIIRLYGEWGEVSVQCASVTFSTADTEAC